jgi:ABC-type Fe3+ transport system permease subunit
MGTRIEVAIAALATLLTAILCAITVARLSSKLIEPRRIGLALLLSVLSIPGFAFSIYYLHILPEMEWLYQLRSFRCSGLWLAVPLAAVVSWNAFLYRPFALLLYASALITVALPYAKPFLRPLDQSLLHDPWQDSACLQSTESTCGPASAATIC